MTIDKQTAANRQNAQKSTGPKTPGGRAAVRLNSLTHGLTAKTLVLPGESEEHFGAFLDSLVTQLAMATWRLRRLYHQEAGFYTQKLQFTDFGAGKDLDDSGRLGLIADSGRDVLSMFNRREARPELTFYKALHELERFRTLRPEPEPEVEIGSAFHFTPPEPQPEPFQPDCQTNPALTPLIP